MDPEEMQPVPPRTPYVGADVLYVLDKQSNYPGQVRPAKIVRVWGTSANLAVSYDGSNDYVGFGAGGLAPVLWQTSVPHHDSQDQPAPRTWIWPDELRPTAPQG